MNSFHFCKMDNELSNALYLQKRQLKNNGKKEIENENEEKLSRKMKLSILF